MWNERQDFCLDVHFTMAEASPYINCHTRYNYAELEQIFDQTDVLIVPSVWYETFGYTVLEALSFGVPVIITNTVGAKDILVKGAGIIVDNAKEDDFYEVLKNLSISFLREMNRVIVEQQNIYTLNEMSSEIVQKCYTTGPDICPAEGIAILMDGEEVQ